MTKIVYKYQLKNREQDFDIPIGGLLLAVQDQGGLPCLWFQVDPNVETETRTFRMVTTGEVFKEPEGSRYLYCGTVQIQNGTYVVHVYEEVSQVFTKSVPCANLTAGTGKEIYEG